VWLVGKSRRPTVAAADTRCRALESVKEKLK
jgi:hypothetical protein